MEFGCDVAPLISVIVAVLNGNTTLLKCIDSVARQTYAAKELIIIDGGSKDGTVELLIDQNERIDVWLSESDRGVYSAWNKGLRKARGEWICFLGADDFLWDEHVLERMAVKLEAIPSDIRVVYGQIALLEVTPPSRRLIGEPWERVRELFRQNMCIPHVGTLHRRDLFDERGVFDESFVIAGDYEYLLRELRLADAAFISDIVVAGQTLGGLSTNHLNLFQTKAEIRRAKRIHGLPLRWGHTLRERVNEFLQFIFWKIIGARLTLRIFSIDTQDKSR